jgi:cytochrome c
MVDFGNKIGVWDYNHIYLFIAGPQAYLSGTKMGFVGLKQPQDRVNLIAWLRQQSSSPVPIPAPNPAAAGPAPTAAAAVGATPANQGGASTPVAGVQTKTVTGNTPVETPASAPKPAGT